MSQLRLGKDLSIPLDVTSMTSAILGVRGTGKTNTAGVLVEEAHAQGQRSVIMDPLDVWWGLKSSEDGEKPGLPAVVFGGVHQDLPLAATQGAMLADVIVETEITAVLSIAHLSKGERTKFAADFFERLYHRKAEPEHRDRLLIVIDEASSFVPQSFANDVNMARCVGAVEDLVRRGRSRGVGVVLVDQRAATVNKNVLTQLEVLIAHRQVSPQDRKAVKEWVEASDDSAATKDLVATIASLGTTQGMTGEAWVWSPYLDLFQRTLIRKRWTFDSSATPKAGEVPKVPKKLAAADLEALRAQLAGAIEEAQESDPKALKAQVAELKKQIAEQRPSEVLIAQEVAIAIKPYEERTRHLEWIIGEFREITGRIQSLLSVEVAVGAIHEEERSFEIPEDLKLPPPLVAPEKGVQKSTPPHPGEELKPKQQAMLDVLADLRALKVDGLDRKVLAGLTGQSPKSSQFDLYLRELRNHGYVDTSGLVRLTAEGIATAHEPQKPPSLADLHRAFKRFLSRAASRCLDPVIKLHPRPVPKLDIARLAGISPTSSSFDGGLRELRTFGLIEGSKEISATGVLFPKGLK